MTVEDFKANFNTLIYTQNNTNLSHAYWLAKGNGDTIGTNGTTSFCGSSCKRSRFIIRSSVSQYTFVSVHLHSAREYVDTEC